MRDALEGAREEALAQRAALEGAGASARGWAAEKAAFEKRIKACIANCGPYNWGALWDKLPGLTRDAYIQRSHSKTPEEAHQKAFQLSLEGVAEKIECPMFVIAGGLDRLCPPEDAERLAREAKGATVLLVIPDGNHVAHNRAYKYRNQSADWMAEQLSA
jgi:2,6-dihydroxypseudooxynicotine hydrolase